VKDSGDGLLLNPPKYFGAKNSDTNFFKLKRGGEMAERGFKNSFPVGGVRDERPIAPLKQNVILSSKR